MAKRFSVLGSLLVVWTVVVADQVTKVLATRVEARPIVPVRNAGLITGMSPMAGPILVALTAAVLVAFLVIVGRWSVQVGISPLLPALVTGGMLAHGLDRLRFGAVRDFLATGWLIIDVADLAVVTGLVGLAVAFVWRLYRLRRSAQTITFELRTLRAVIVDHAVARAA